MTTVAQLAGAGVQVAPADAGLSPSRPNPHAVGVILGVSTGSFTKGLKQQTPLLEGGTNWINPWVALASLQINSASAEVAITARTRGPAFVVTGGCASTLYSISVTTDMIRNGTHDVYVIGRVKAHFLHS